MRILSVPMYAVGGVLFCSSLISCQKKNARSDVLEGPDSKNAPSLFGIDATIPWSAMVGKTAGSTASVPWTDTWWPFSKNGLAWRWALPPNNPIGLTAVPPSPFVQIEELHRVIDSGDVGRLSLLSAAEKYDVLLTGGQKMSPADLAMLQANHEHFSRSVLPAYLQKMAPLQTEALTIRDRIEDKEDELDKRVHDDVRNEAAERALDAEIASLESRLESIRAQAEPVYREARNAMSAYYAEVIDIANELAATHPMVADSWKTYAGYAPNNPLMIDWDWMGYCNGWSPAALHEERPRHAVMAVKGKIKVLFTEGDIRGLLSRVWASQTPAVHYGGKRCNQQIKARDRLGRILDGKICMGQQQGTCQNGQTLYLVNNDIDSGKFTFVTKGNRREPQVAVVIAQMSSDNAKIAVYPNQEIFVQNAEKIQVNDYSGGIIAVAQLSARCRDTNPMTLHLAMLNFLQGNGSGFVMDRVRSGEVWNQPTFKYELRYIPIPLKDGSLSQPGAPVPVEKVDDLFKRYRAKGTASLVQVEANLYYIEENGPKIAYQPQDDTVSKMRVRYTLELNAAGQLVGGEWGWIPTHKNMRDKLMQAARADENAPDFIWTADKGDAPKPGMFNYDLIKAIHRCSLTTSGLKPYRLPGASQDIPVSECPIP